MLGRCDTLWIGDRLSRVERACLRSVMRAGHRMRLYCYRPIEGVPEGVEMRDAAEILPERLIIRHRDGSVALFANWFRYELLRRGEGGLWIDTDLYVLKPLDFDAPFVFGEEEQGRINIAVFKAPSDSPLLTRLVDLFEEKTIPFWLSEPEQAACRERLEQTGKVGLGQAIWGVAGPAAITAYARQLGLDHWAQGVRVFYPAHWTQADWILDPAQPVESFIFPETRAIHLWNEKIKGYKESPAPPGAFLARLQAEGA